MRNTLHGLFKQTAEAVLPPLSKSAFEEKRVLTPAEFVRAGDYLVRACPTWSWEGGDAAKARSYLPPNKQYLVTRGVPCLSRAATVERYDPRSEFALGGDDEGWVATHQDPSAAAAGAAGAGAGPSGGAAAAADDGIPDLNDDDDGVAPAAAPTAAAEATAAAGAAGAAGGGDDDVPDISELELVEPDDEAALPPAATSASPSAGAAAAAGGGSSSSSRHHDAIRATRTYDLYVTYDQYYQVPRMWLVGFDEAKAPLNPAAVLEDVSEEHARKTITLDAHPHLGGVSAASIHPCRHADVMKKLADNVVAGGGEFLVDHYLVLFLKFIASVVPTISYDHTMSVGGGGQ